MATVLWTLTTNNAGGTHLTISSNSEQAAKSSWVFLLLFPRIFLRSISRLSESSVLIFCMGCHQIVSWKRRLPAIKDNAGKPKHFEDSYLTYPACGSGWVGRSVSRK